MTMESHPAIDGEPKSSRTGGESEASKESKKRRRKERRADKERTHERAHAALEPLTIWVRTDPNRLQHPEEFSKEIAKKSKAAIHENTDPKVEIKTQKLEVKPEERKLEIPAESMMAEQDQKPVKQVNVEDLIPKAEEVAIIPEPVMHKSASQKTEAVSPYTQEMPELQDLPRLEIRPRHFYTEPEIRQPGTTEAEHDILPPLKSSDMSRPAEKPASEQGAVTAEKVLSPAEQLQELAEQKTRRAEELERKNREEPAHPEIRTSKPKAEVSEHVQAIIDGKFESNTTMKLEELLEVADSVHVDGVSISEMFRAGRLDEEGLRRIMSDFLRGHRIERVVAEEILRQQLRFERDPQLRQIPLTAMQDDLGSRSQSERAQQRKVFNKQTMRRQADRIADRLAEGIDRTVEAAENNPNMLKTFGAIVAVIAYFVVLILIIRS